MSKETQHDSDDATVMDLHDMRQNFTLSQLDPPMDLFGESGNHSRSSPIPFTAQPQGKQKTATLQRREHQEIGRNTSNSNPFAMGKTEAEHGRAHPAEQIPQSHTPVISQASAIAPPPHSQHWFLWAGQSLGLLIGTAWRRTGSQSWLRTHKSCHNTKSSVVRQCLSCCSPFMSLLSWEGGEQQHLSVRRADRRKEKSFQESVLGEAASAGALGRSLQQVFPSWSLQLPHGTVHKATGPGSGLHVRTDVLRAQAEG